MRLCFESSVWPAVLTVDTTRESHRGKGVRELDEHANVTRLCKTSTQPAAGEASGGDNDLSSGFWGWLESFFDVYLPLVLRNNP